MSEINPIPPSPNDLVQAVSRLHRAATLGATTRTITQNYVVQAQQGKSSLAGLLSETLVKKPFSISLCAGKHGKYQQEGFCCDVCEASNKPSIPVKAKSTLTKRTTTLYVTDAWMQSIIAKQKGNT